MLCAATMAHQDQPTRAKQGKAEAAQSEAVEWPSLEALRLLYIHRAIEHMNNNKTRAAELLGIDRRTLNRILARERARRRSGDTKH
jgi:DNA-binding NtrC family response regulator